MRERITIKDIAKNTGTSVASVHRALHGSAGVGEELRRKILQEANKNHYRVDENASLLRRGSLHIAVLLPKAVGNERFFYRGLWQGIRHGAARLEKQKIRISLIETEFGPDDIARALERLYDRTDTEEGRIDGLVTLCDDENAAGWIQRFIRRGVKVALIDRSFPIEGLTCSANVSVSDMGALAMEMGWLCFKRFSCSGSGAVLLVNGPSGRASYRTYAKAVRSRAEALWGEAAPRILEIPGNAEEEVRAKLQKIIRQDMPGVILTASARTTFWVCDEIRSLIPDTESRPSVVGTDVFPELEPFFADGTLKATIFQSHLYSGEKSLEQLVNSLVDPREETEKMVREPLSIVMKDNFHYFLQSEMIEHGRKEFE